MGIDTMSLAAPGGDVELAALAIARGVPPGKFIDGLGVERIAVARAHEDPVALAATAARRLVTTADTDPTTIGPCVVGSGRAVDHPSQWPPTCIGCSACPRSAGCSRSSTRDSAALPGCSPRSTGSRPVAGPATHQK